MVIVALGALWLQHHLGFEFGKLGWVTAAGVAWATIDKVADWLGEKTALTDLLRRWLILPLRGLVHQLALPFPLYLMAMLCALAMVTVSSVSVRSEAAGERSLVSLVSLEQGGGRARTRELGPNAPVARFLLATSPFGRPYQVDAEGYVPAQLTVYPLTGRQVLLGRDLAPSPSVLFRPFVEGMAALSDGAVFTVTRLRTGSSEPVVTDSGSGTAKAFRLGPPRPISDAMVLSWTLEATAHGAPEALRALMLITWRNPKQLAIPSELNPHDCLLAEIRLNEKLKARGLVLLGDAPLVDVLLQDVVPDRPADTARVTSC